MEAYKKQKSRYQLCNNVDLKNNKNYNKKKHSDFSGCAIAAINSFQVDLNEPLNEIRYCYEKTPLPLLLPPI